MFKGRLRPIARRPAAETTCCQPLEIVMRDKPWENGGPRKSLTREQPKGKRSFLIAFNFFFFRFRKN